MKLRNLCAAVLVSVLPLHAQAQATWVGGTGNTFSTGANWSGGTAPTTGTNTNLTFGTASPNNNVALNASFSAGSLTATSGATNGFTINGNSNTLTINGGLTSAAGGNAGLAFNNTVVALGANQTWQVDTNAFVTNTSSVTGAFSLTKTGSGTLSLAGNNSYSGGTTVSAGSLFLGSTNSSSGTITVASGATLGTTTGDTTLSNTMSLASGAILGGVFGGGGGSLELNGATTVASGTMTLNVANYSNVFFGGTVGAASSTALTVHSNGATGTATGTGIAVFAGATSNISSITADNGAVAFANASALPAAVAATNGGYVSVVTLAGTTPPTPPTATALINAITDKPNFNGTIGFDTDDDASHPTVYADNINLSGFTAGNVKLGSQTSAVLTGTITPAGSSYDFGGYAAQDGVLFVKSNLGGTAGLTVTSPSGSGGAPQNGPIVALMGTNTFSGNISTSYGSVIVDSAGALPTGSNISLGAYSYASYTETAGFANFAAFVSRISSATSTSILGIDSHDMIDAYVNSGSGSSVHTVSSAVNLSGYSSIYLGTLTAANISGTITAPTDGIVRLVNLGEDGFTVSSNLTQANGLVAGMAGSSGSVTLTGTNTYGGGTTLDGGGLLAGNNNALSSGTITVNHTTGDNVVLGASTSGVTLANAIVLNGTPNSGTGLVNIGSGHVNDTNSTLYVADSNQLTLTGDISGTGRLFITGATTLGGSGDNTYTGGTYIFANTTVSKTNGLGTSFVDLGYGATLTFSGTASANIGSLADSSGFISGSGTGNIALGSTNLTLNGTQNGNYSGVISGSGSLNMSGTGVQTLTGTNTFTGGVTLTSGTLAVNTINNGGSNSNLGAASNAAANLVFNGGNLQYNGSTASTDRNFTINAGKTATIVVNNGAATLTMSGATAATTGGLAKNGGGTLVLSGTNAYTGATTLNGGTLSVATIGDGGVAGNLGAATNAAANLVFNGGSLAYTGSTASTDRNFTINASRTATINVTNTLTMTGASTNTNGALTKSGAGTLVLSGDNLHTGTTTVSTGTLQLGSGGSTGAVGGAISVNGGATLALNHSGTATVANSISGSGALTNLGGTNILTANNGFSGTTTVSAGTLQLGNGGGTGSVSGGISVASGATLALNRSSGSFANVISGAGSLTNVGGSSTLTGNNTYAGGTSISAGTLQIGTGGTAGSGAVDISSGATLQLNRSGTNTFANTITGAGGVTNSAGTTTLSGTNTYTGGTTLSGSSTLTISANANLGGTGAITFNSGTLKTTAALGTVSRALSFSGAGTIDTNGFNSTFSGALSGANTFTKSGSGKLTLTGTSSSFTGQTAVSGGTLVVDGSLANSSATTVANAALLFGSGSIGAVTINSGGTAGAASTAGIPATFTAASMDFQSGSKLEVFMTDATAAGQGTGWGLLSISGALNFNASPVTIMLASVNGSGNSAAATFFNSSVDSQYLIATATGGISGFSSGNVTVNTSLFTNSLGSGSFTTSVTGNNLYLNFTAAAIPEPSTYAALFGLGALGLALWRRRSA